MRAKTFALVAWAAAIALASPLAHASVVANGGFESGDFTGWTVNNSGGFSGVDGLAARSGSFGAFFGDDSPGSGIEQTLATVAGRTYAIDFWLQLDDSAVPNAFSWSWDGATQAPSLSDAAGFAYARVHTLLTATDAATTLRFDFINPQSFWLIDEISVALPEPGGMTLAATALLLLGTTRRRRGG